MSVNVCEEAPRQAALQEYFGLVRSIAARIKRRLPVHVEVEDLVQTGMIGLLEARNRYDASRAVAFSSYANSRITGAILDELRRSDPCSRADRRAARALEEARQKLRTSAGEEPDAEEIARAAGVSLAEYNGTLHRLESSKPFSLQIPEESSADEIDNLPSSDENPFQVCSRRERWLRMKARIDQLKPRQREVIYLCYFEELGLKEIGERLGVGEARVSQIRHEALTVLRRKAQTSIAR